MLYKVVKHEVRTTCRGGKYYRLYLQAEDCPVAEPETMVVFDERQAKYAIEHGVHGTVEEVRLDGIYEHVRNPKVRRSTLNVFVPINPENNLFIRDPREIAASIINNNYRKV